MNDNRELLDRLITQAVTDIDALTKEYSEKEISNEQIGDMKRSGYMIMFAAYLASIANSLAFIADHMDEKGEKLNEETDRN